MKFIIGVFLISMSLAVDAAVHANNLNRQAAASSLHECRDALAEMNDANLDEAIKFCGKVAESGDVETQFYLGVQYLQGEKIKKDLQEAERWFGMAAKQGHVIAQYELMTMYVRGSMEGDLAKNAIAYGWLCVLEKQIKTPGSPGLAMWQNPKIKLDDKLKIVRELMEGRKKRDPVVAGLGMDRMCKSFLQSHYKAIDSK